MSLTLTIRENEIIEIGPVRVFYRRTTGSMIQVKLVVDAPRDHKITRTGIQSGKKMSINTRNPRGVYDKHKSKDDQDTGSETEEVEITASSDSELADQT